MMLKVLGGRLNTALCVARAPVFRNIMPLRAPTVQHMPGSCICRSMSYEDEGRYEKIPIAELQVGQQLQGTVKSIVPFGCFVDVGATSDGLVHISQLTDGFVRDVLEVVNVGDEVSVRVLSVEGDRRLSLTMKSGDGGQDRAPRRSNRSEGGGGGYERDSRRDSGYDREPRRDSRERW